RKIRRTEIKTIVKADHVFDRIDRHAALADFSRDTIGVAIDAVERRAIERGAEPVRALMLGQIMKTLVGVLGEHQAGEQTRWLFGLRQWRPRWALGRFSVFFEAFDLTNRL